jgi:prepilin-type N-terminal cleavage/methylation domain-containing protein
VKTFFKNCGCCKAFRACSRAFTLVEMLVVMLLLSLIVGGLMAMFNETQKAFRLGLMQTDVLEGGRALSDLITSEMTGITPSYGGQVTNFYADIPDVAAPWQQIPGDITAQRTNTLENVFFLTRVNQKWLAYGFCFTNPADGAATLFRFYAETNINANPGPMWSSFIQQTNTNFRATNLTRLMDGVVQFRIRAYDTNGIWIVPGSLDPNMTNNALSVLSTRVPSEMKYIFTSNAVPAYVEFELGILEKRAYERFKAMPDYDSRTNFLAQQVGSVHLFRQRVPIRSVDFSAYQ